MSTEVVEIVENEGMDEKMEVGIKKNEEKKSKYERHPELERNPDLITIDTVLAPLPKKNQILLKPNIKDYQERESKNKQKSSKLYQKKQQLFDEKFKVSKQTTKGDGDIHEEFNHEVSDFKDLKEKLDEVKIQRKIKKDLFAQLINDAKNQNAYLKQLRDTMKNSKQSYEAQLEKLEHRLLTQQLSKKDETNLNNEIVILKRKIREAVPQGNAEAKIVATLKRKEELDLEIQQVMAEKQPLEQQYKELKQHLSAKNESITKIKGEIKSQKQEKNQAKQKHNKQYEEWKQNKKKKMDDIVDKLKLIQQENKNIWKEYHDKNNAYWQQKQKIDFLEWQYKIKDKKIKEIQKQKKKVVYQLKEKQREKQQHLKKYNKEIQLCEYLVTYLKEFQKQGDKQQKQEKIQSPKDINAKLGENAQWQKEKGLVVLQSKKSKEDDEPVKKGGKKNKKKGDKGEKVVEPKTKKLQIPLSIHVMFDTIRVLPPQQFEEVEKKRQQIKERRDLFQRACGDSVNDQDKQVIQKLKGEEKKDNKPTVKKTEEEDFPTL